MTADPLPGLDANGHHRDLLDRIGYRDCPVCGVYSGPLHLGNPLLWRGRADRAARNGGTDPLSGCSMADAEAHVVAIETAKGPPSGV